MLAGAVPAAHRPTGERTSSPSIRVPRPSVSRSNDATALGAPLAPAVVPIPKLSWMLARHRRCRRRCRRRGPGPPPARRSRNRVDVTALRTRESAAARYHLEHVPADLCGIPARSRRAPQDTRKLQHHPPMIPSATFDLDRATLAACRPFDTALNSAEMRRRPRHCQASGLVRVRSPRRATGRPRAVSRTARKTRHRMRYPASSSLLLLLCSSCRALSLCSSPDGSPDGCPRVVVVVLVAGRVPHDRPPVDAGGRRMDPQLVRGPGRCVVVGVVLVVGTVPRRMTRSCSGLCQPGPPRPFIRV